MHINLISTAFLAVLLLGLSTSYQPIMQISGTYLFVTLLAPLHLRPVLARDCFWPDGSIAISASNSAYLPCGPDDGVHSGCCVPDDGCSTEGYCFGLGYMYRGGCTDQSWNAPECPQYCRNSTCSFLLQSFYD